MTTAHGSAVGKAGVLPGFSFQSERAAKIRMNNLSWDLLVKASAMA